MRVVDLTHGPVDPAALNDAPAVELRATQVEPEALAAALAGLREVRGLKELRVRSCVRALPPALTELRGLQRLELVDAELPGLPGALGELTRLRSLRLELNHLASLPRSIAALTRLRELYIDSHHLCGLPDGLRALQELRALTLLLRHEYVHDWEHPAHFPPRFEQSVEALFALLATLPALASLTIGEPDGYGWPANVFVRLPPELAGLHALEVLALEAGWAKLALPYGVVMPGVRRIRAALSRFEATEEELQAMFPNAVIGDDPRHVARSHEPEPVPGDLLALGTDDGSHAD